MPILRKDGRNILFIHVPKTGGTTIEKVFQNSGYRALYLDSKVGRGSVNSLRRCSPQHLHAELLRQTFRIQNFDFLFLISRDPIARFKSEYIWRNRKKAFSVDERSVENWGMKSFQDYTADPYIFDNHLRPQIDFHIPGTFIYKLEDGLENIVNELNDRFDCGLETEIPKIYDSKARTGYSSKDVALSTRMEQGIRETYREDFRLFGYQ
ncbi:sulfotransferase family 2 domain-containing protein [Arthrobacter pigmenti]